MVRSNNVGSDDIVYNICLQPLRNNEIVQPPETFKEIKKIIITEHISGLCLTTHHPTFLALALAMYVQKVYALVVSGYRKRNVSINPLANIFVIPSLSSMVKPALFLFVFGFARSVQNETGSLEEGNLDLRQFHCEMSYQFLGGRH